MMIIRNLFAAVVAAFFASALQLSPVLPSLAGAQEAGMALPVDPAPLVIETDAGERTFTVEIADSPEERARGLMFRESMKPDHGMLFVFEQDRDVEFWMKNTPMPLDLIFISRDGTIKAIRRGQPFSEAGISAGLPVRFVLELRAGTSVMSGLEKGDKVKHRVISDPPAAVQ